MGLALAAMFATALAFAPVPLQAQAGAHEQRPDRVMVRFRANATASSRSQAITSIGGTSEVRFTLVPDLERIYFRPGRSVADVVSILRRHAAVLYAEPDFVIRKTAVPNDPQFAQQWGMNRVQAPKAWDLSRGDQGLPVAILDSGIDRSHPDLQGNLWQSPTDWPNGIDDDRNGMVDDFHGWDFAYNDNNPSDVDGHGTRTAGIVGARGDNRLGVAGINWRTRLVPLRVLDDWGNGFSSNAIMALQYAARQRVRVALAPWGTYAWSQALHDAVGALRGANLLLVASAGNGGRDRLGDDNDRTPVYPASFTHDNVISVTATDSADRRGNFGNFGRAGVDLGAPGVGIMTTSRGGGYAWHDGTSGAAAHVAGAAALVAAARPTWTYAQIRDAILRNTRPVASLSGVTVTGGMLNLAGALSTGTATPAPAPAAVSLPAPAAAPGNLEARLQWVDDSPDEAGFRIERSINGGSFVLLASVGSNVVSYTATGLLPGTTYQFRVRSFNGAGQSDPSNAVTIRAPGPREPPQAPTLAGTASRGQANLNWSNVLGETGYHLGRAAYDAGRRSCGSMAVVGTMPENLSRTTDPRPGGGRFCFAVRAFNSHGTSPWSNVVTLDVPR